MHVVRFEDLVARNTVVTESLGRFAGVTIDLELPDTSAEYDSTHAFWTAESGRAIEVTSC